MKEVWMIESTNIVGAAGMLAVLLVARMLARRPARVPINVLNTQK
jgi:hypothetical protein